MWRMWEHQCVLVQAANVWHSIGHDDGDATMLCPLLACFLFFPVICDVSGPELPAQCD
jgi:hypothetical protein